jgi:hypothetical protein
LIHGGLVDEKSEGVEVLAIQSFLADPVLCLQGASS